MEISSAQQQALASNYVNSQAMESADENQERRILVKPRQPADEQALRCPRCESTNTKFCYYNNYSLSQPRHFCKGCRRYWTQGGSLRNVPFGGGCRKNNKRSSSNSSSSSIKKPQDHQALVATDPPLNPLFPNINLPPFPCPDPSDHLTLALSWLQNPDHDHAPHNDNFPLGSLNPNPNNGAGILDILKSGILDPASYPTNGLLFNNGACSYNIGIAFDHLGLSTSSATTSTYEEAQGQFGNNDGGNKKDNDLVDANSSRGYRINGYAGNTNYAINSSLM